MPLEESAEKSHILITHGVTDLLHGAMIALQQPVSGGEPQLLSPSAILYDG